jgi:small subunit ribosomal protein S7
MTEKTEEEGLAVWKKALNNVIPSVEVKRRRVGGSTFQIPIEVRAGRKVSLGVKWLVNCARARGEKTMTERLVNETIAASKGEGNAVKKKNDIHKMAESNRAFSHFRIR